MSYMSKPASPLESHRVERLLESFVSVREIFVVMRGVLCLTLVSLLIVITLCESGDNSESVERTGERDSHEVDSVDADVWLCRGKRSNQLCDGGEGRCVWARRARRMICIDMDNNKDHVRDSKED